MVIINLKTQQSKNVIENGNKKYKISGNKLSKNTNGGGGGGEKQHFALEGNMWASSLGAQSIRLGKDLNYYIKIQREGMNMQSLTFRAGLFLLSQAIILRAPFSPTFDTPNQEPSWGPSPQSSPITPIVQKSPHLHLRQPSSRGLKL